MTTEIAISCIMPVYNSEKYLRESVQSILNQTFSDFELICVEDCSPDQSLAILREFEQQDERIKVLHNEENIGAAKSRNRGLDIASGKYIICVDSDDKFSLEMFSKAYECAEQYQADVVCWSYHLTHFESNEKVTVTSKKLGRRILSSKELEPKSVRDLSYAVWNKMIKKELIDHHVIRFQNIPNANDCFFTSAVLFCANKIITMDECLMTYRDYRDGNTSGKRYTGKNYELRARKLIAEYIQAGKFQVSFGVEKYWEYVLDWIMIYMSWDSHAVSDSSKQFLLEELQSDVEIKEAFKDYILCNELNGHSKQIMKDVIEKKCDIHKNIYTYCLDSIIKLRGKYSTIALWGCGQMGKAFLDEMDKHNVKIDFVVDVDTRKYGTYYREHAISDYREIKDRVDIIIIPSEQYREDVEKLAIGKCIYGIRDF